MGEPTKLPNGRWKIHHRDPEGHPPEQDLQHAPGSPGFRAGMRGSLPGGAPEAQTRIARPGHGVWRSLPAPPPASAPETKERPSPLAQLGIRPRDGPVTGHSGHGPARRLSMNAEGSGDPQGTGLRHQAGRSAEGPEARGAPTPGPGRGASGPTDRRGSVPWRWVGRTLGALLFMAAALVLTTQLEVGNARSQNRSCGSAWDVLAGRVGWPQWWSADLEEPADRALVRTLDCPNAVNQHGLASGALAVGALAVVFAGEVVDRRLRVRRRPAPPGAPGRVKAFGMVLTGLGVLLTLGGLAGIALLVANPGSALFLYVRRPVVVLAGLLLLLPAILLCALGQAAVLMADHLRRGEDGGDP